MARQAERARGCELTRPTRAEAFAVVAPGLEGVAAAEMRSAGLLPREHVVGGIPFSATPSALFRANLELRTVTRVLVRIAAFRATTFRELERVTRGLPWEEFLSAGARAELRVTCRKSKLYHSDAVAQRVREAIARRVRDVGVATAAPEAPDDEASDALPGDAADTTPAQLFVVRFDHDECQISADASGALLHRRGYRLATAKAPLRETLAAAALLAAGYDGRSPLLDPLCGAGTIAIEAAMIARHIAPGLGRSFACERWPNAAAAEFAALRDAALSRILEQSPAAIVASDRDEGAIAAVIANAKRAGVGSDMDVRCCSLSAATVPAGAGLLLTNPPYGARVGGSTDLRNLYAQIGNLARRKLAGWTVAMVSADRELERQSGLPLEPALRFRNGGIPVRLMQALVSPS